VAEARSRRRLLGALAACMLAGSSGACRGRPPSLDQQARTLVSGLEVALEEKDYDRVRELLAPEFRGQGGDDLDRRSALLLLRTRLSGRPSVHLVTRVIAVDLAATPYRVEVVAAMASLPVTAEQLSRAEVEADVYRFHLDLVPSAEQKGALVVASARWEPARLLDFQ
jgi:hypothetical protein